MKPPFCLTRETVDGWMHCIVVALGVLLAALLLAFVLAVHGCAMEGVASVRAKIELNRATLQAETRELQAAGPPEAES